VASVLVLPLINGLANLEALLSFPPRPVRIRGLAREAARPARVSWSGRLCGPLPAGGGRMRTRTRQTILAALITVALVRRAVVAPHNRGRCGVDALAITGVTDLRRDGTEC